MQQYEKLKVYIRTENGRTVCMYLKSNKRCTRQCEEDEVSRDRYKVWESTMSRNRWGK